MYLQHFGLTDYPFIQSAKDQLYFSADWVAAHCDDIHHWLDAGHGMLLIAGEHGVGRASLAHHALDTCDIPSIERYVLSALPLSPVQMLQSLALDLGVSQGICAATITIAGEAEAMRLRHEIRTHLRAIASLERRVCIIVENADQLDPQTLSFLEDLSKDHTLYLPLCHIIFLVEKPFAARIKKQQRRSAARHSFKLIQIKSLSLSETRRYIQHRLVQAGWSGTTQPMFSAEISKHIFQQTTGKPQLINVICDQSMLESAKAGASAVKLEHLQLAIEAAGWESRLRLGKAVEPAPHAAQLSAQNTAQNTAQHTTQHSQLGALEQTVYELISGVTTIGRAPDCTIRIDGADFSPYQALIVRTEEGMFIRNEGRQVALYLNGNRVQSANLNAGDTVALQDYRFRVESDDAGALNLIWQTSEAGCELELPA